MSNEPSSKTVIAKTNRRIIHRSIRAFQAPISLSLEMVLRSFLEEYNSQSSSKHVVGSSRYDITTYCCRIRRPCGLRGARPRTPRPAQQRPGGRAVAGRSRAGPGNRHVLGPFHCAGRGSAAVPDRLRRPVDLRRLVAGHARRRHGTVARLRVRRAVPAPVAAACLRSGLSARSSST